MTDEERLHELAVPYALDALEPDEREAFEAHLGGCADCRAEVAELQEAAVGLSEGWETAPPADLRRRVLAEVALEGQESSVVADHASRVPQERASSDPAQPFHIGPASTPPDELARRRRGAPRRWVLAAAAALVIGTGTWAALELATGEDPGVAVVRAADAVEHDAETPEGRVVVITSAQEDAAVLRLPDDLAGPEEGRVYQAWFVGADGTARSAGVLDEDALEDGEALLDGPVSDAAAVGLSVEPAGGSEQPTTEPFAVVPLG